MGLGGGKSATSSGRPGGGRAYSNEFSLALDGTNDFIAVGNDSSLAPANLTLSCWFKASGSIVAYNYLISRNGNAYGAYHLRYTSIGNRFNYFLGLAPGGGDHKQAHFDSTVTLTDWHHVALTYDTRHIKGYVDGIEDYSFTWPGVETYALSYAADSTYGTDTWIGKGKYSDPAQGVIDEVAVFSSALSASDITAIYNDGIPADLTDHSPVGWWRMGEDATWDGSNWTIPDASDNDNAGTSENMAEVDRVTDLPGA